MKSAIDKNNKFWKWKKADKKIKNWYKKQTGLNAQEFGIMKDEVFKKYGEILLSPTPKQDKINYFDGKLKGYINIKGNGKFGRAAKIITKQDN